MRIRHLLVTALALCLSLGTLGVSAQSTWDQIKESKKIRVGCAPSEPWYYRDPKTGRKRKVSYGQAGKAKGGGPRVKPGTSKGDAYCARSAGQMKRSPKAAKNPNSPLRLSRKRWKCSGTKSRK